MGYIGNRMSERAAEAYRCGEKPLSQWTKEDVIYKVIKEKNLIDGTFFEEKELKNFSATTIKNYFLDLSSWHHTGSYFNETNFYMIDYNKFSSYTKDYMIESLKEIEKNVQKEKEAAKKEKEALKVIKCKFSWVEWTGTRKHPKPVNHENYGLIYGNWIYFEDGKKSLKGNYTKVLETYKRAPKGTAEDFKYIEKKFKKIIG